MERFKEKRVLVTGAASGIGKASALRLGKEGAHVVCTDINEEGLKETVEEIKSAGGKADGIPADISQWETVQDLVEKAVEILGGGLDILVNVAGMGGFVRTETEDPERFDKLLSINLYGPFYTVRASIKYLLESKGNVVNVASIAGVAAHPYAAAYCASKGGLVMMTKALAMEYAAEGVRFNAICPGGIQTPMLKVFDPSSVPDANMQLFMRMMMLNGRFADPSEIAGTVAYIASDEASFMTGSVVLNDGGSTL